MNVRRTLALGLLALSLPLVLPASLPAQAVRIPAPAESPAMVELRKELRIAQAKLDLLKKENDRLRKENQALKGGGAKPDQTPAGGNENEPAQPEVQKIVYKNIEYQYKSANRRGDSWVLTVIATSQLGKHDVRFPKGTAYAKGGGVYTAQRLLRGPGRGMTTLPQEIPVELHLEMGPVPSTVHDFIRVEITPDIESSSFPIVFNNIHLK